MSFSPILKAPDCEGFVGICNFSPNNWEIKYHGTQLINITWAFNGTWITKNLGELARGSCRTINASEVSEIVPEDTLPLLTLTSSPILEKSDTLPQIGSLQTMLPVWRSTLGLASADTQTTYQGELDFFPAQASLLTFGPFLQLGKSIKNYLLLLNIESSPKIRYTDLEVYDATECDLIRKFSIRNNFCNIIPLDDLPFNQENLPLFICRNMAAIPLYFSSAMDGAYLSLEHSHPPASLVVHGKRWEAQRLLKNRWFAKVTK